MKVFEWPGEPCHWLWKLWELAKRTREAVVQRVCALLNCVRVAWSLCELAKRVHWHFPMGSLRHAPLPCWPFKLAASYRCRPSDPHRSPRLASSPRAPRPTFFPTPQAGCCVCLACTGASTDPPLLGSTGSQVGAQARHQRCTTRVPLRRRQPAPAGTRGALVVGLGPAAHRCPNRPSRASNPSPRPAPPDLKKEWSHQARRLLTYGFAVLEAAHCCACLLWLILRVQHFPPGALQRGATLQAARGHGWPPPPPPTPSGAVH